MLIVEKWEVQHYDWSRSPVSQTPGEGSITISTHNTNFLGGL